MKTRSTAARLVSVAALCAAGMLPATARGSLRISEVCPQPATVHPTTGELIDAPDPCGRKSGWVELVNSSATESVDLANYELQRINFGKKAALDKQSALPSRSLAPGERVLVYTSDSYDNDEDVDGLGYYVREYETPSGGSITVVPFTVNPKKRPMVRLVDIAAQEVVDTFLVPVDLAKGKSIVAGNSVVTSFEKNVTALSTNSIFSGHAAASWDVADATASEPLSEDSAAIDRAAVAFAIDPTVESVAKADDAVGESRTEALVFPGREPAVPCDALVVADSTAALSAAGAAESAVSASFCFFAYAAAAPKSGRFIDLISAKSASGNVSEKFRLYLDHTGALVGKAPWDSSAWSAGDTLFDGRWHHVALALGRSQSDNWAVWLDGELVWDSKGTVSTAAIAAPAVDAVVQFAGVVTRPRVFSRTLFGADAATLYANVPTAAVLPDAVSGSMALALPANATRVRIAADAAGGAADIKLTLDGAPLQPGTWVDAAVRGAATPILAWTATPTENASGSLSLSCDAETVSESTVTISSEDGGPVLTERYILDAPTPGADNGLTGALAAGTSVAIGPNAGPLSGVKHSLSDWKAFPVATPGEDYAVALSVNPVSDLPGDAIASVRLIYRADFGAVVTNGAVMAKGAYNKKGEGQVWNGSIPAAALPEPGHLLRWAAVVEDAAGRIWRTPSFNDPDNAYEWYGTIVDPTGVVKTQVTTRPKGTIPYPLASPTLQTFHIFADPDATAPKVISSNPMDAHPDGYMDKQSDDAVADGYPCGARVGIYDGQTGLYYDNVRIDLRGNSSATWAKKSHGLRFNKSQPLACVNPFDGSEIEIRKTSLIAEFPDPARARQALSFKVLRDAGCLVPFDYPVRVNLNAEFYQLAFHSARFTDELIEDFYGLDPNGYAYKNVGTFNFSTSAGGIEKKTPDDGDEGDLSVLNAFCESLKGTTVDEEDDAADLDNAALTKKVATDFDLPAWLNYLAATRITQEADDMWANLSAYFDVHGTGTWMPLAYDMNVSWGQSYKNGGHTATAANADWHKSHPLYGGYRILAHSSASVGTAVGQGNRAVDAIFQSARYRRMFLRRLRTLMDEILKAPGTAKADTPFWGYVEELRTAEWADYELDFHKWGNGRDTNIYVWNHEFNWDYNTGDDISSQYDGTEDLWNNYVVPRRVHLFETHLAVNATDDFPVGYAWKKSAGIPDAQAPTAELAPGFAFANLARDGGFRADAESALAIMNSNDVAVDMSGWSLAGQVEFTFAPGTVIDAGGTLVVTTDRKAWIAANAAAVTDQLVVGNARFVPAASNLLLRDDAGVPVVAAAPATTFFILR